VRWTCRVDKAAVPAVSLHNFLWESFTFCTSKLNLNVGKKVVQCHIWSTAFYGAEIWTIRKVYQKHLESFGSVVLAKERDQLDQ
jgi:hypothetical protein